MLRTLTKAKTILGAQFMLSNYVKAYTSVAKRAWSTLPSSIAGGSDASTISPNNDMKKSIPTPSKSRFPKPVIDRSFSTARTNEILSHLKKISSAKSPLEGQDIETAVLALANADAVCFDVDSTVIQEEGIDVLADSLGKGAEVSAWTTKAMDGDTKFEDALAARLEIIQPSRESIEKCLEDNPLQLSPGVERLVEALMENGTDVYLVSGGFRIMIEPVAKTLCIAKDNIVANTIFFDEESDEGAYAGFCRDEPTSADMGKPKAVQMIKEEYGYETVVMVGDGATDAQAKPPADAFIGFGGVTVREAVREKACWYVHDFQGMIDVVEKFGKNVRKQ